MRRRHRAVHRRVWLALAILLPAVLLAGFALREDRRPAERPVRLAPP
jgi:hypothetical protein